MRNIPSCLNFLVAPNPETESNIYIYIYIYIYMEPIKQSLTSHNA